MHALDRRSFLKGAACAGGALAVSSAWPAAAEGASGGDERKTKHLVLIAFAGGVRTRETFGTPQNVPTLRAMADEGVLYTRARTANLGHYGAALSIFTGISEPRGIRENARGPDPTVFEYLRKDLGLPANEVWITTSGGAQQVNYAYGLHPDFGARYGANTLDGDGIFNREFKSLLDRWGRPRELPPKEEELLARMRAAIARTRSPGSPGGSPGEKRGKDGKPARDSGLNSAETSAQVEKYILQELTRGTADLTGANAADAKAMRLARNVLSVFRPRVVAVALQEADIAHGSYNGYVEMIRRNDAALGEMWQAVRQDPALAGSTAFIVVPEFGRDRDLNSRRGLDHGDGSEDLAYVTCLAWGPDFRRGSVVKEDVQVVDVAPTVCDLFGAKARHAHGRRLPGLYA